MLKLIWRTRAAIAYWTMAGLDFGTAWDCAGSLIDDYYDDGATPVEAVREDLTYWTE